MEAPLLRDEVALLQRLLYKNKNQHRTTLHYRRLAEAARRLRAVLPDGRNPNEGQPALCSVMYEFADALMQGLPTSASPAPAGNTGRDALRDLARRMPVLIQLPCRVEGRRLLSLLIASEEQAEMLSSALLRAYRTMRLMLSQTNFMPFCTVMLALTARLHSLLAKLPEKRTRCLELLAACESQLPDADGGATEREGGRQASPCEKDQMVDKDAGRTDSKQDSRSIKGSSGKVRDTPRNVAKQLSLTGAEASGLETSCSDSSDDEDQEDDWGELLDSDDDTDGANVQLHNSTGSVCLPGEASTVSADEFSDTDADASANSDDAVGGDGVRLLASMPLTHGARLCVSAGSVLDFGQGGTGWPRSRTAVVNAANTGGLGGGGVDGAFVSRGGAVLAADREALPVLGSDGDAFEEERIRTGGAAITGPKIYGSLFANTVRVYASDNDLAPTNVWYIHC